MMNHSSSTASLKNESTNAISTDILDDLCSRFIVNVPEEERRDPIRLCFQIEQAHWFYIDFYCSGEYPAARSIGFKDFAYNIFRHLSFLRPHLPTLERILEQWKEYKMAVPTYGAVLLNQDLTKVLLVQGFWSKSSWGFPKGKVNEGEDPARCAAREVLEETGFDASKLIDSRVFLETIVNDQITRLYVVPGIQEETKFIPKTRNEIRAVQWFPLADLPVSRKDTQTKARIGFNSSSFFMVVPFVKLIRNWVSAYQQKQLASLNRRQRCKSSEDYARLSQNSPHTVVGSGSKQSKSTNTRRQLFPQGQSQTGSPAVVPKVAVEISAPSWQNFKLDLKPILACFENF
nr:EOG090X07NG [Eulimnadia texana]